MESFLSSLKMVGMGNLLSLLPLSMGIIEDGGGQEPIVEEPVETEELVNPMEPVIPEDPDVLPQEPEVEPIVPDPEDGIPPVETVKIDGQDYEVDADGNVKLPKNFALDEDGVPFFNRNKELNKKLGKTKEEVEALKSRPQPVSQPQVTKEQLADQYRTAYPHLADRTDDEIESIVRFQHEQATYAAGHLIKPYEPVMGTLLDGNVKAALKVDPEYEHYSKYEAEIDEIYNKEVHQSHKSDPKMARSARIYCYNKIIAKHLPDIVKDAVEASKQPKRKIIAQVTGGGEPTRLAPSNPVVKAGLTKEQQQEQVETGMELEPYVRQLKKMQKAAKDAGRKIPQTIR